MAKILRNFKFSAEIGKITFGYTTYQIMSGKEKFKRLKPKLDLLNGKLDTYQLLAAAALQGGKDRTLAKNNCVTEIVEILNDLGDEVEEMSKTDNLAIADSSFQQTKEVKSRANKLSVTELPTPTGFQVTNFPKTGVLTASFPEIEDAILYQMAYLVNDGTVWIADIFTALNKDFLISGFTKYDKVKLKMRAISKTGVVSDWSDIVAVGVD